ncbi:MAG: tyrosine-type recombinase/integrase [Alphaproteobacteria bacterium]|nr:tyrosine-type recombinase/integrase [Alphaproteobacteria bacterium]
MLAERFRTQWTAARPLVASAPRPSTRAIFPAASGAADLRVLRCRPASRTGRRCSARPQHSDSGRGSGRVRKDAGIEDVRLHGLRHAMASHAVMSGVPAPVVSRLLGHSNVRMALRYARLADRDIEEAT